MKKLSVIGFSLIISGIVTIFATLVSPPYLYHTSSCSPSGNCVGLDADWYPVSHYVVFSIIGVSILSVGIAIIVFSKRRFKNDSKG
ncbi:MAG: hypothetical protein KGH87_00040 [Thaumarchaeota archaeon]|nr:hypothetical protein [Nitrososphaerota archaeon]